MAESQMRESGVDEEEEPEKIADTIAQTKSQEIAVTPSGSASMASSSHAPSRMSGCGTVAIAGRLVATSSLGVVIVVFSIRPPSRASRVSVQRLDLRHCHDSGRTCCNQFARGRYHAMGLWQPDFVVFSICA